MNPKPSSATTQPDFFQAELKSIINPNHPLVKLAKEFNWDEFEKQLQPTYAPVMGVPGVNALLMVAGASPFHLTAESRLDRKHRTMTTGLKPFVKSCLKT